MLGNVAVEDLLAVGKTHGTRPIINDLVVLSAKVDLVIGSNLGGNQLLQPAQNMCAKGIQALNCIGLAQKFLQGPEIVLAQAQQGRTPVAREYTPKYVFAPVEGTVTSKSGFSSTSATSRPRPLTTKDRSRSCVHNGLAPYSSSR